MECCAFRIEGVVGVEGEILLGVHWETLIGLAASARLVGRGCSLVGRVGRGQEMVAVASCWPVGCIVRAIFLCRGQEGGTGH